MRLAAAPAAACARACGFFLRPPGIWNGTDIDNYTIDGTNGDLTLHNFSYSIREGDEFLIENEATLELEPRWLAPTAYYDNCKGIKQAGSVEASVLTCEYHHPEAIVYCQPACETTCTITDIFNNATIFQLYNNSNSTGISDFADTLPDVEAREPWQGVCPRNLVEVDGAALCDQPGIDWQHSFLENITIDAYNLVNNATNCQFANGTDCHLTCVESCVEFCDNYTIPLACNNTGWNSDWQPVNFDNFGWAVMTLFTCIIAVGWTDIQYKFQDAYFWGLVFYFTGVMVVGTWVILNMAIAVLADAYNDQDSEKEEAEKQRRIVERAEKRAAALEDAAAGIVRKKIPPTFTERWKARCDLPEALVRRAALHRLIENKFFKVCLHTQYSTLLVDCVL